VHWQPRCSVCRLSKTAPEAYAFVTSALLEGCLTQDEIAGALATDWGVTVTQSQLSNHKTKHLDPDLADARESFVANRVFLEFAGDMPADQMAVLYAQLAMVKLGSLLKDCDSAKLAAPLATAIASLSKALQTGVKVPAELQLAALELRQQELREQTATADFEDQFAAWVEQHYPHLVPQLAAPTEIPAASEAATGTADPAAAREANAATAAGAAAAGNAPKAPAAAAGNAATGSADLQVGHSKAPTTETRA
jgi:hypothetical protein